MTPKREAQVLANLNHANLPRVTDELSLGANEYLVMDFIEGTNLQTLVEQHGAQSEATVLGWVNQLLDALAYIHKCNLVHRDIKPSNIILTPDDQVMLVDFGLVKVLDPNNPYTLTILRGMGTPGYAPIEQYGIGTHHTDARTDLYALGATMYFLLTARAPTEVHDRVVNPATLPAPSALNTNISAQTESVVLRAMEVQPQKRFASAGEMRQAVNVRATAPVNPNPNVSPSRWLWEALRVALGVGEGILYFAWFIARLLFNLIWWSVKMVPYLLAGIGLALFVLLIYWQKLNFLDLVMPTSAVPIEATMVMIPAGEFKMGSDNSDVNARIDEKPQRLVYLDAYWIDKYEVTNAQYEKCVNAGKCTPPSGTGPCLFSRCWYYGLAKYANYPVVTVNWVQAKTYCEWAGKRLPTEAEWEKAARGTDGRIYPWGNSFDGTKLNSWGSNPRPGDTTQVGAYPSGASPYGTMDMAGNVWEWVADWYDEKYYASSPRNNPSGPSSGQYRVLRGGSWFGDSRYTRAASRNWNVVTSSYNFVGFRCARGL